MTDKPSLFKAIKKKWKLTLLLLIVPIILLGIQWITYERQPLPEAIKALESDSFVTINHKPWLTFSPTQTNPKTGFIFYPGGRIDPQGYAPLMNTIASEGYLVILPEMPLNIAAFRPNIVDEIIKNYPDIDRWVIGGHSVGGVMAAQYTSTHRENIDGLALWAAYPADNADLSSFDLPVLLNYGSRDPGVNDSSVMQRQHLLPEDTRYIRIDGGDHHQFGSYEINPKDHFASIDRVSQQEQITQSTINLLKAISDTE